MSTNDYQQETTNIGPEPGGRVIQVEDVVLVPCGYGRLVLPVAGDHLNNLMAGQSFSFDHRAHKIVVNVETQAVRYLDTGAATSGYGELYQVGAAFERTVRPRFVSLAAEVAGAIANVSFYRYER